MTRTEELLALAEAATPGPWVCDWPADSVAEPDECPDVSVWQGVEFTGKFINNICFDNAIANGNFIAAANPETIKQLVELVRLQHEALDHEWKDERLAAIEAFNKWDDGK